MQDLLDKAKDDFEEVLEILAQDLMTVKTGRAKPDLIQQLMVEAYEGQPKMPLMELASITSPDPHQLIVKPWDQSIIEQVEKSLAKEKDLSLSPVVDGEIIRIKIPPLTEERRKDLVKLVKQKLESGRVILRRARHEIKEKIDEREGQADVSEDDLFRAVENLNKLTDEYSHKIEEMGEEKEKELLKI